MATTTNFEPDFSTSTLSTSKRKSLTKKRLSNFRRRLSTLSYRNSIIFMKPDLEGEEIINKNLNRRTSFFLFVKENNSSSQTRHKRAISEPNKFEEIDFFDDFEEAQYTPIFKRNKSQMNIHYEEPTNEVILDEPSFQLVSSLIKLKTIVKKFTKVGQDKKGRDNDKEYQDGKTNPF
ncbi:hypothetical protein C1645_752983, partial [Glomus cerebriforme]